MNLPSHLTFDVTAMKLADFRDAAARRRPPARSASRVSMRRPFDSCDESHTGAGSENVKLS